MFPQAVDLRWICQTRPLSSASWALAPPNSLRYQNIRQPVLLHPFHHACQPEKSGLHEEDWEESLSLCVLVQQGESANFHTLQEIPLLCHTKLAEALAPRDHKPSEFCFPLTTVDGSREDDISISSFKTTGVEPGKREHGCFRSLFEAESCPAPFMYGSRFYCFHCPGTEPGAQYRLQSWWDGLDRRPPGLSLLHRTSLFSHAERAQGEPAEGDGEGDENLALMYERLRIEVRIHSLGL